MFDTLTQMFNGGYDKNGYNKYGYNKYGTDKHGFSSDGKIYWYDTYGERQVSEYTESGFDVYGIYQGTNQKWDSSMKDIDGTYKTFNAWNKIETAKLVAKQEAKQKETDAENKKQAERDRKRSEHQRAKAIEANRIKQEKQQAENTRNKRKRDKIKKERGDHNRGILNSYDEVILDTNIFMGQGLDGLFEFFVEYNVKIHVLKSVYDELTNLKDNNPYGTPKSRGARTGLSRIADLGDYDLIKWDNLTIQSQKSYADPILIKLFQNNKKNRILISNDADVINRARAMKQNSEDSKKGHIMTLKRLLQEIK